MILFGSKQRKPLGQWELMLLHVFVPDPLAYLAEKKKRTV